MDERLVVLVASNARLQELGPEVHWGLGGVPEGVSPSPVACPRGIARGFGKSLPFHQVGSFVHMDLTYFYAVLLQKKKSGQGPGSTDGSAQTTQAHLAGRGWDPPWLEAGGLWPGAVGCPIPGLSLPCEP